MRRASNKGFADQTGDWHARSMGEGQACDQCGWAGAGGRLGCRARFETFLARDFSDPAFFRSHRMLVDTYCLQHPDEYCASAKSLAAHLVSLCWIIEGGAGTAVGPERLHRWLSGSRALEKPPLPDQRGDVTLGDLPQEGSAQAWAQAVRHWADSTWAAYSDVHGVARQWMAEALTG